MTAAVERSHQPLEWGVDDCALWVADAVKQASGHDPAAAYRGRYANAREAIRLWREAGGFDALIAGSLEAQGWREIDVHEAQDGDIGLCHADYRRPDRHAVTLHFGGYWTARAGIGVVSFPDAIRAWTRRQD